MKAKKQNKFSLEKFEIAKLTNAKTVVGGDGPFDPLLSSEICSTDTNQNSTIDCAGGRKKHGVSIQP